MATKKAKKRKTKAADPVLRRRRAFLFRGVRPTTIESYKRISSRDGTSV